MNKTEIDKLITDNLAKIVKKNDTINELKDDIVKLYKDRSELEEVKKIIIFELITDYISIDQEIQFEMVHGGGLSHDDIVTVIRKNKKSVTVKFLSTKYSWNKKKVGTTKRIPARVFGEAVYKTKAFKKMVDRDEILRALLD